MLAKNVNGPASACAIRFYRSAYGWASPLFPLVLNGVPVYPYRANDARIQWVSGVKGFGLGNERHAHDAALAVVLMHPVDMEEVGHFHAPAGFFEGFAFGRCGERFIFLYLA